MAVVCQFRTPLPCKIHVKHANKACMAMTTFKETRDLLVVGHHEEWFLLYDSYTSEKLDLWHSYPKFDIIWKTINAYLNFVSTKNICSHLQKHSCFQDKAGFWPGFFDCWVVR